MATGIVCQYADQFSFDIDLQPPVLYSLSTFYPVKSALRAAEQHLTGITSLNP
jgi:hypothetical protein